MKCSLSSALQSTALQLAELFRNGQAESWFISLGIRKDPEISRLSLR